MYNAEMFRRKVKMPANHPSCTVTVQVAPVSTPLTHQQQGRTNASGTGQKENCTCYCGKNTSHKTAQRVANVGTCSAQLFQWPLTQMCSAQPLLCMRCTRMCQSMTGRAPSHTAPTSLGWRKWASATLHHGRHVFHSFPPLSTPPDFTPFHPRREALDAPL